MKPWLAAAVGFLTCASVPHTMPRGALSCVTRCGLQGPSNCVELAGMEARAVEVFGRLDWGGPEQVCRALKGWRITLHQYRPSDRAGCEGKAWVISAGMCALGYTEDATKEIELPDDQYREGALTHELVHVLDLEIHGRAGHCLWNARGVKAGIEEIQGYPDVSRSERWCMPDHAP